MSFFGTLISELNEIVTTKARKIQWEDKENVDPKPANSSFLDFILLWGHARLDEVTHLDEAIV